MTQHTINKIYTFLLLLCIPLVAMGQQPNHSKWMKMSTAQLLDIAQRDIDNGARKDTAVLCYSILANRYDTSMTFEQKKQCVDANML